MIGQIIVKESAKDMVVIIGEEFRTVLKADKKTFDDAKALVEKYNAERVVADREEIATELLALLSPGRMIEYESDNRFVMMETGHMCLAGTKDPIPEFLANRLLYFIEEGIDIEGLINFWRRLLLNPDTHVRGQLYKFLEHNGHPITSRGYFLAYKSVGVKRKFDKETGEEIVKVEYDEDTGEKVKEVYNHALTFKPFHSGSHGMTIKIGEPITMPREDCDNDPKRTCSAGLHVGSMAYVGDFGGGDKVVLECLISPTDVVSVPEDYNATKMRTCKYFPIAISNGENNEVFLESDYDTHQKGFLEEEMKGYQTKIDEHVKEIEASVKQNGDILDSLF